MTFNGLLCGKCNSPYQWKNGRPRHTCPEDLPIENMTNEEISIATYKQNQNEEEQ